MFFPRMEGLSGRNPPNVQLPFGEETPMNAGVHGFEPMWKR